LKQTVDRFSFPILHGDDHEFAKLSVDFDKGRRSPAKSDGKKNPKWDGAEAIPPQQAKMAIHYGPRFAQGGL
jgi:hypothetical protein